MFVVFFLLCLLAIPAAVLGLGIILLLSGQLAAFICSLIIVYLLAEITCRAIDKRV